MQPHLKYLFSGLSVAVFLSVAGCHSDPSAPAPAPPKVSVRHPEKRELTDYEEFNGWLVAKDPVEVRSKVRGFVNVIHFKDPPQGRPAEGEVVTKGTPLFDLDPEPFKDEIIKAEQKVNVNKAQKVAAEKEFARLDELEKKGGASKAQVEKADADVKSLDASIKGAEAEVKLRVRDLEEYSKLTAPIDGRVSRSLVAKGALVETGNTLLTTINSIDPIKVEFHMDEQSVQRFRKRYALKATGGTLPALREAQIPFKFRLDTDAGFVRSGIIDFADNQTDRKTGKILVRGETENKKAELWPGDHVRVQVPISDEYQALLVPDTAVNTDQDKRYLLVLDDKDVVHRRDVRLGKLLDNGLRVIETNLKPMDRVIIEGTQKARIGKPVTAEKKDLKEETKEP